TRRHGAGDIGEGGRRCPSHVGETRVEPHGAACGNGIGTGRKDHGEVRTGWFEDRRQRKIVHGQAVVGAGGVEVGPAEAEAAAVGDGKAGDLAGHGGAVGGVVAVLGAGGGGVGRIEVQRIHVHPAAVGQAGGIEAVLEVEGVDTAGRAQAPLFAGVGDVERGDFAAHVVGEGSAEAGGQRPAEQATQGAFAAAAGAEAVAVAGVAAARARLVL